MQFMRFSLILCVSLSFAFCKTKPAAAPEVSSTVNGEQLPADFVDFYQKFHQDSQYQMAHIQWPLQGEHNQSDADSSAVASDAPYYWKAEKWIMHKPIDYSSGDFVRELETLGDMMVIERINTVPTAFGLERRFAKLSRNEWSLIYYSDIHEVKKGAE